LRTPTWPFNFMTILIERITLKNRGGFYNKVSHS
jgi:hypothetical protein